MVEGEAKVALIESGEVEAKVKVKVKVKVKYERLNIIANCPLHFANY